MKNNQNEEKNIKISFYGIKQFIHNTLKNIKKICYKCALIVSTLAFITVPFLFNILDHTVAQWIWYPSCALFLLFTTIDCCNDRKPIFESPPIEFLSKWGGLMAPLVFTSIFVFSYYNIDHIWFWVVFGGVAVYIPAFFVSLLKLDLHQNQRNEDERNKAILNICKYIFLYLLLDLFYMAVFNSWTPLLFIFGIPAVAIIFYNLAKAFLYGSELLKPILIFDFLCGLCVSSYLIYSIPDASMQKIILTITAAVFGGVFTLVGVAWTIKHTSDTQRKEEVLKAKPFFGLISNLSTHISDSSNNFFGFYSIDEPDCKRKIVGNFVNSGKNAFLLKTIKADEKIFVPDSKSMVTKNDYFQIGIFDNTDFHAPHLLLVVEDENYNEWKYIIGIKHSQMISIDSLK